MVPGICLAPTPQYLAVPAAILPFGKTDARAWSDGRLHSWSVGRLVTLGACFKAPVSEKCVGLIIG